MNIRRSRLASVAVFAMTGLVSATWAARIPATQQRLDLSPADLALGVLAIEGGALLGLPAGGLLVGWRGSRWALRLGFVLYPGLLLPIALAPSLAVLCPVLMAWAMANSIIDVAMNAAGVELESSTRRPTMSLLHAAQSCGLLGGGLLATAATASTRPLWQHFAIITAFSTAASLMATTQLPKTASSRTTSSRTPTAFAKPEKTLLLLGLVAFCGFLIDGSANTWIAVSLRTNQHASPTLAAAGYSTFVAAVAAVRMAGNRAIAHVQRTRLIQLSGLTAAIGAVVVVTATTPAWALAGWILVAAGMALIAPIILAAAPTTGKPATAIAAVTTLGYLGSFSGSPAIGALTNLTTLPLALLLLLVAAVVAGLLAGPALRHAASGEHPRR